MRTAAIFTDYMVLQREKPVKVWGDGRNGRRVTVFLGGYSASCTVRDGKWRVTLPPMPAAEHLTMKIRSGAVEIVYREIAVGEVWLCGGQSNMEYEIKDERNGKALLETLTPECGVRYFYTPKQRVFDADFEKTERSARWETASPEKSRAWSAVGLYFALELHQRLGVTVGLIGCNWGGTSASAWVSRDVLEQSSALRIYLENYEQQTAGRTEEELNAAFDAYLVKQDAWWQRYCALKEAHPETTWAEAIKQLGEQYYPGPMGPKNELRPCGLYETMLRRVSPYTLRGFLYYQGESDDWLPEAYAQLLSGVIGCWRHDWEEPELPFLNVQLPMYCAGKGASDTNWCGIRGAQEQVYRSLRNTGLAVLTDCGEPEEIHPADKEPVGHRLALQALCEVYHKMPRSQAAAPIFRSGWAEGSSFVIQTDNAENGFRLTGEPEGFLLAGADGVFVPAKAVFGRNRITLTADTVKAPCAARYAWANYMQVHVFGMNGLPLAPFRTDAP